MKIIAWGTRGSIAISNPNSTQTGGNTTCYEVQSKCLPNGTHLMLDAGTGFVPAGWKYLSELGSEDGLKYVLMFTHWHYDHIVGLTLAPPTFIPDIEMSLYGPVDAGVGPKDMVCHLFKRPFFPVDAERVNDKMTFNPLKDFDVSIIVIHPEGGFRTFTRSNYVKQLNGKQQLPINGKSYNLRECLVVTMQKANHGNSVCITYRFEEMPTGKVFVLCTDHEDEVGIRAELKSHCKDANLLIIDAQYNHDRYMTQTTGFGHGTPRGITKLAVAAGVKKVGVTHHDPQSTDEFLDGTIFQEGLAAIQELVGDDGFREMHNVQEVVLSGEDLVLCCDYMEFNL